jgi:DNA-binding NarL/FixJ family response regulator
MTKISILIADDHALIRQTWNFLLHTHSRFQIVGESSTGEQTVAMAAQLFPDVVIMDINMPDVDGLEATRRIRLCSPHSKVIGVSSHTQPAFARKMLQNGAMGYVTKSSSSKEFFAAIHAVLLGNKYICEEIKTTIAEQVLSGDGARTAVQALTTREMEVIERIKKGQSSSHIGEQLYISVKTVEVHRYNILKKLNLKNTAALVNYINQHLIC